MILFAGGWSDKHRRRKPCMVSEKNVYFFTNDYTKLFVSSFSIQRIIYIVPKLAKKKFFPFLAGASTGGTSGLIR